MREPIVPQMDAAAYLLWEESQTERFELHHGFAVAFAGGTVNHDRVSFMVRTILERLFPEPCRSFGSEIKVQVAKDSFYYADAGVVCEEVDPDATSIDRPTVVVEVLSRSTRGYDLIEKRAAYRALPTLKAYVIVHTDMRRVEVDERVNGNWATRTYDHDEAFIGARQFALREIYGE
jgi:Uma2 family endonuclease